MPAGGAVQQEAWLRGQTVYCPDERISLYPPAIGEGAASLLPDQERPALVYVIELDGHGRQTAARVDRAIVRSHRRLAYGEAEVPLLEQIGTLRLALARERGSITLNAPAQTVVPDPSQNCGYRLELEHRSPDEDWNAEISLLAGMAAAGIMVSRGLGLLRTMGGADPYRVKQLQTAATGAGRGLARGPAVRRVRDLARPGAATAGGADRGGPRRDGARRLRLLRGHGRRRAPSTPASPPATPTRPRRCGGWPTATCSTWWPGAATARRSRSCPR